MPRLGEGVAGPGSEVAYHTPGMAGVPGLPAASSTGADAGPRIPRKLAEDAFARSFRVAGALDGRGGAVSNPAGKPL